MTTYHAIYNIDVSSSSNTDLIRPCMHKTNVCYPKSNPNFPFKRRKIEKKNREMNENYTSDILPVKGKQ